MTATREHRLRGLARVGLVLVGLAWGSVAAAQGEPVADVSARVRTDGSRLLILEGGSTRVIPVGCRIVQALLAGDSIYLTCGRAEVIRVQLHEGGEAEIARTRTPLAVQSLQVDRGAIWALLFDGSTRRVISLDEVMPAAPPREAPATEEPGAEEPGVGEPSSEEPGVGEPGVGEPTVEEPAIETSSNRDRGGEEPQGPPLREVRVLGSTLHFRDERGAHSLPLGCRVTQALTQGRTVYAHCGGREVLRVRAPTEGEPELRARGLQGRVRQLLLARGAIWALLFDGSTHRVASLPEAQRPVPSGPAAALGDPRGAPRSASPPASGSRPAPGSGVSGVSGGPLRSPTDWVPGYIGVVRELSGEGRALVELRTTLDLGHDLAVELVRPLERGAGAATYEVLATARVTRVEGREAEILLAVDERASVGLWVRSTASTARLSLMPPLPRDRFELSYGFRAVVGSEGGGAAIQELRASYLTGFGLRLGAELSPLTLGTVGESGDREYFSGGIHATIGYATRWGELGAGIGWVFRPEREGSFSLEPRLRVGNADGISVAVHTRLLIEEDLWRFGAIFGDLRFPVAHGLWVVGEGGWWSPGRSDVAAGVRLLVLGNGGGETLFVTAELGWGWLLAYGRESNGPSLGGRVEWRL